MKFCPNCGEKIEDGAKVCTKCGCVIDKENKSNVTVKGTYATFWERVAATLIDGLILGVVAYICGIRVSNGYTNASIGNNILTTVLYALYYAGLESSQYQASLGKMVMHLKVTDENGNRISFANALGRYFGKMLSSLILGIGYLLMLGSPKSQCLHDMLAHTLVVKE